MLILRIERVSFILEYSIIHWYFAIHYSTLWVIPKYNIVNEVNQYFFVQIIDLCEGVRVSSSEKCASWLVWVSIYFMLRNVVHPRQPRCHKYLVCARLNNLVSNMPVNTELETDQLPVAKSLDFNSPPVTLICILIIGLLVTLILFSWTVSKAPSTQSRSEQIHLTCSVLPFRKLFWQ